jgi:hypothetical protein
MNKPAKFISLGPGLAAPAAFTFSGEGQAHSLEASVVFEEGRFIIDQLTFRRRKGGPPITTESIRQSRLATLLHLAVESQVVESTPTDDGGYKAAWPHWSIKPALSERARAGGGPSDEDLRSIATVYQVAYALGAPPTRTVMERFGLPRSTASRWIRVARERGLLGPATPRKAGG